MLLSGFSLMSLSLIVMFLGALFIYIFRGALEQRAGTAAAVFSGLSMLLMLPSFYHIVVFNEPIMEVVEWSSVLGSFGLLLDGVAFPITFAVVILGFLSVIYAIGYTSHTENRGTFFSNLLFFIMGMQWVTLATNLVEFFMAWELMLVPSYFLILFWGIPETRKRTAMKFWLYTQSGALAILAGFALLYAITGSFVMTDIGVILTSEMALSTMKLIFILLAAGFLVKMAVFPIHWWLPPVHAEAPTPVSVLLSGAMIETGAYALVRFGVIMLGAAAQALSFWVSVLGVLTMFYGGLMALAQKDIKRLLAYSSVSQMGYVLFALGVMASYGLQGGLFHLINHAFSKGLLFMTAGAVIHETGTRNIEEMGGLSNRMPVTAFTAAVGAFSIAGVPPLSGFASEWMMFNGGFQAALLGPAGIGSMPFFVLSILAVSSTIVSAGYMLRFVMKVFLGPLPTNLESVRDAPRSMTIPMVLLGALIVFFGVFPDVAVHVIAGATQGLLNIVP